MKGEEGKGERGGPRVSFFAEDFRRNKDRRVKEKACRAKSLFLSLSPSLTFFLRDCAARKTSNYRAKFQSALNNLRWPLRGGRNSCCVDAVSIREGRRARVERSLLGPCLFVRPTCFAWPCCYVTSMIIGVIGGRICWLFGDEI